MKKSHLEKTDGTANLGVVAAYLHFALYPTGRPNLSSRCHREKNHQDLFLGLFVNMVCIHAGYTKTNTVNMHVDHLD